MYIVIKENVDYTLVKNDVKNGSDFEVLVNGFEKGEYLYSTKFETLGDAERNFNTLSAMEVR